VLGILPLVALTQVGFTVAFGVLLDTAIVRSILVPALTFELAGRTWWPSRLWKTSGEHARRVEVTRPATSRR
jgi:RND superfamily putative drug exporter